MAGLTVVSQNDDNEKSQRRNNMCVWMCRTGSEIFSLILTVSFQNVSITQTLESSTTAHLFSRESSVHRFALDCSFSHTKPLKHTQASPVAHGGSLQK